MSMVFVVCQKWNSHAHFLAHWFSISRDSSWKIIVVSRSRSRATYSRPSGRGSNSVKDDDDRSSSQEWRQPSESYSSEDSRTPKRTGSDGMNGDVYIISSSGFCSGRGLARRFSRWGVAVAKLVSLSFSSRLPWDARSFSSGRPRKIKIEDIVDVKI